MMRLMTAYYIRSATFIYWLLVGWYDLIMSTHLINVNELSYNIYALTYMSKHIRTNFQHATQENWFIRSMKASSM